MNGNFSDDRLSAWLDNELSIEERAEVEQLLAESSELRDELHDFEKLRMLLRNIPQKSAPTELHAAVMRAVERESLLSATAVAEQEAASPANRSRRFHRILSTAVALAVVAGLGVFLSGRGGRDVADNSNSPNPQEKIVSVTGPRGVSAANKRETSRGVGNSSLQVESRQRILEIRRDDLDAARIGDIVEAVETSGDTVSVIRLTVINRSARMQDLQVLLSRQDILNGDTDIDASTDSGLVAVYVQSDSERLRRAMTQLRDQLEFDSLDVTPSVQIAELGPDFVISLGIDSAASGAETSASQKRVAVSAGSRLEQIVRESAAVGVDPQSVSSPPAGTETTQRAVRVIFVLVDPDSDVKTNRDNGAAS